MTERIRKFKGANMDIDLLENPKVKWEMERCPWNEVEGKEIHKCAVKNISICKYLRGIQKPDVVLCAYPSGK